MKKNGFVFCSVLGLNHKSAPQCVTALTICLLEMRDAMVKLLPEVLLTLTKISTTVHVAIPTLEFLSSALNMIHSENYFEIHCMWDLTKTLRLLLCPQSHGPIHVCRHK